jgi:hypothetical protein
MSIDTLILNILERYISYFYEKVPFLTSEEVNTSYFKINDIRYIAVYDKNIYYGVSKFYKIYDPITGVFVGTYNDESKEIQYDEINDEIIERSYIDVHSNNHRFGRFKLIYEVFKYNTSFISKKIYEHYHNYDDKKPEHLILNEIIKEIFENNEDNYNEIYFKLFYYSKYDYHYNQFDGTPIEEQTNNQDYENFKNTNYINNLHGESKNIEIVMSYINTRINDNYIQEYINDVIYYYSHPSSILK